MQYRALRYATRLREADAVASVGSRGDSYDCDGRGLNSLYKGELIHLDGPWDGIDDVEAATTDRVAWFNNQRIHSMLNYQPVTFFVGLEARLLVTGPGMTFCPCRLMIRGVLSPGLVASM